MAIELTEDEIKNGWTPEKLEAYLIERDNAARGIINHEKPDLPVRQKSKYSVHHWRR